MKLSTARKLQNITPDTVDASKAPQNRAEGRKFDHARKSSHNLAVIESRQPKGKELLRQTHKVERQRIKHDRHLIKYGG